MKLKEKFVQLWNKFSRWLSVKKLAIGAFAAFLLSLLPILYLTVVNRASGDDYGYGKYTRPAWVATHSLIEVAKAIGQTIRQYYYGWQGTWFSIALFTLQPEVFHDKAYIIVTPLMLLLWIGSTFYLFREILVHHVKTDKWGYRLITVLFLFISIQFIPGKKSSLYWFNGCAHYMIPFTMCQFVLCWLLKWGRTYYKRYFVGILLFMTLLGGSNYQAALLVFLFAVYYGMYHFIHERSKRIFLLLIPIAAELAGLLVSMLAPGNKARGGEAFGLSAGKLLGTIGMCFVQGFKDAGVYLVEQPLVLIGMLVLFLLLLDVMPIRVSGDKEVRPDRDGFSGLARSPWPGCILLVCLYCAMQAPALYAGVEVSQGVGNTNFQVLLLTLFCIMLILAAKFKEVVKYKQAAAHARLVVPGLLAACVAVLVCRHGIKETTDYICYDYIRSGQAADYKEQMDLQTSLLLDSEEEDVVIPMINDWQGPLMQMPVTGDASAWANYVTADFYEKRTVVAIPRTEWNEKYKEGE